MYQSNIKQKWVIAVAAMIAAASVTIDPAIAQSGLFDDVSDSVTGVSTEFRTTFGIALVTLAIILLGAMAWFGRLTIFWAVAIIGGSFLVFGSSKIANLLQSWFA